MAVSFEDHFRWRRRKALGLPNPKKPTPEEAAAAANEAAYQKELAEAREKGRQTVLHLNSPGAAAGYAKRKAVTEDWVRKRTGGRIGPPVILPTPAKRQPKQPEQQTLF